MTVLSGPDIQRAIDFLSGPASGKMQGEALPARPDYDAIARYAGELGHDLSPEAVREAFRLMMRARLLG
jgi:hypothetical protein